MESDPLFDVLVIGRHTRKVYSIAATRLHMRDGYYNAIRWQNTMQARVRDEDYEVVIVNTGAFKIGDVVAVTEVVG